MKTLLFPLSLWLAIASLVSPLTAQSVSKLELEKSSALNAFESVTIIPATVTINRPPIIASQPTSQFVESGSAATLTVSATGSAPFTYQWYRGNLGVTTAPVGTNSPTFTTPALTVTTEYWVKISNAFG